MKHLTSDRYNSPIGEILILADGDRLCYLDFAENHRRRQRLLAARYGAFSITPRTSPLDVGSRLDGYFAREWDAFDDLDICTDGTDFQRRVWRRLKKICVGKTPSYHDVAQDIDPPSAPRAVGNANTNNPIAIIIPCHRVIGRGGSLRGYAGGVHRQAWLLGHEGARIGH